MPFFLKSLIAGANFSCSAKKPWVLVATLYTGKKIEAMYFKLNNYEKAFYNPGCSIDIAGM